MKHLNSLFIFFCITSLISVNAQIKEHNLPDVIVTATRTSTPTLEIASSYSIITADELKQFQHSTVLEVLKTVEGLNITQQGGRGTLSSVFVRGAKPYHTLVMIDGMEVNDPSSPNNAFDLSTLLIDNIEKIEIVRGPQSTLYGGDAVAGVINIITQNGRGTKPGLSLLTEGGSNNYYKAVLSSSGQLGNKFDYSFSASQLKTDGISVASEKYGNTERDGFESIFANAAVGYRFDESLRAVLKYRYNFSESDLDQSGKFGDDPNYTYDSEDHLTRLELHGSFFDEQMKSKIFGGLFRRITHSMDKTDSKRPDVHSNSFNNATRVEAGFQSSLSFIKNNLITIGAGYEKDEAETSYRSGSEFGPFESVFPEKSATTTSAYFQNQFNGLKNLFFTFGLRYDNHDKFGSKVTYRLAPAYYVSLTGTKIKATYGTGFKAPTLFYLYDPAFGNIDLKPEESNGFDVGIEQFLFNGSSSIELTYFNTKYENMFGFDENFITININKVETSGIEASLNLRSIKNILLKVNYTYTNAKDKSPGVTNEKLVRVPEHTASININYNPITELNLNGTVRFTGEREDDDFSQFPAARVTLADYLLVDFAASYEVYDFLRVFGRVNNLFDKYYEDVLYYGSLGRTAYIGLELTY